jgi:16S rRNA (adenine1518-N6/adenine1519-N6)-dimethyltransferase
VSGLPHPREVLARWGLRPQKRYGQHFLVDTAAATAAAHLCVDGDPSVPVLEIGAGTGALTHALLSQGATVTAIDIDAGLLATLREREDLRAARFELGDALTFDYSAWAAGRHWRAAGNLPYNIATPLVLRLLELPDGPQTMTFMLQKDVALRLTAAAGSASYGSLSVAVQYAAIVEYGFSVGPTAFYPPPKVQSAVVRLTRRSEPAVRPRDPDLFRKVVRGAFAYRRKTLVNSLALALALPHARIERAAAAAGISTDQRGERLELNDFARLADALAEG